MYSTGNKQQVKKEAANEEAQNRKLWSEWPVTVTHLLPEDDSHPTDSLSNWYIP